MSSPGGRIDRQVDDELAFHIESRIQDLMDEGVSRDRARAVAESEFGDLAASRRELIAVDRQRRRRERVRQYVDGLAQDLRFAGRSLTRSPGYAATAVATIALGLGAALVMFAIVNGVLLRPLVFREPERLVGAWFDMPAIGLSRAQQSASTYLTFLADAHTIDGIGVYIESEVNVADADGSRPPQRVPSAGFTATLFSVLGVPALRGRAFTEAEDQPGAAPVMLISDRMWRVQFGSAPDIVGRRLDINGVRREIVGVMPASFRFPTAATDVWIPLGFDRANLPASAFAYSGVARLKAGVSIADVQRDFAAVLPRVAERFPSFVPGITTRQIMEQTHPRPVLTSLQEDITGRVASTLWVMAAAAALLLLVALVNVANLMLVRYDARQREFAVRETLGAGRARVARYCVLESAAIAAAAGALALGVAWIVVRLLVTKGPADIPRLSEIAIGWRVAGCAILLSALACCGCSAVPAFRILRGGVSLRGSVRGGTAGRAQHRVRQVLVGVQIALALVVLAGSGLLLRSFERLHAVRPGFDAAGVATFWVSPPRVRYATDPELVRFYTALLDRVAQLPGVTAAGLTSRLPLETRGINPNPLYPEDQAEWATKLPPLQIFTTVGGDYFRALRIPILAGASFDRANTPRDGQAIVSRSTAQFFWKDSTGRAALGKRFRALPTGPLYTVVGVVADTHDTTLAAPPSPTVYFPELVRPDSAIRRKASTMALVVRTSGAPSAVVPDVQRAVHDLDPALPTFDIEPMTARMRAATAQLAFVILVLGGAAVATLLLGAIGLYGVTAYIVTLRRREIGIRIALGASPASVAGATTRQGVALATVSVGAGLVLFAASARLMRGFLFGVAPWDPATMVAASLTLLALGALASWVPARRAASIDPVEALRAE
jgi:putative ABC transport system permease protein